MKNKGRDVLESKSRKKVFSSFSSNFFPSRKLKEFNKMEYEQLGTSSSSPSLRSNDDNSRRGEIKQSANSKFPLTFLETAGASAVVLFFAVGLAGVYLTLPDSDYSFLKLPRTIEDLHILRDHLESYTRDYTMQVLVVYCTVYICMQTFMIPGTVFLSLLAGSLFGVLKGVALVVFAATAGASSCYFLSNIIGRPIISSLWPDKLVFFQDQVAKRRGGLLNYMLFLRLTPTLPNTFINVASPIVNVPYRIFFLATSIGLIPAAYLTVRAGIALGELRSVGDLYDVRSIGTLFLIGIASITPTLMTNKNRP
ncbi:hypothetical protein L1987_81329 [Smallanthus sonchifolius]|uniref:Uncharacterized protein n=1 Tax=Smallanthus sonchifolius TaxID=185202 RepID=A0ACB8YPE2_9ASTR|nr:hypothetical protein L1987_81329 [Smallanthus sonchifolius]